MTWHVMIRATTVQKLESINKNTKIENQAPTFSAQLLNHQKISIWSNHIEVSL